MRKLLGLIVLLFATLPAWANGNSCTLGGASANLTTTLSTSGGKWTGTGCTGGSYVCGDGDFCVVKAATGFTTALTLDTNWGTVAGGGVKRIDSFGVGTGTVTISTDCTAPRSVIFGSTGTNPIGSGTATNPGVDATTFGWEAPRAVTLGLTCANPGSALSAVSITPSTSPTTVTYTGAALGTDTGVTIWSQQCAALDGRVFLVGSPALGSFTVPIDTSACVGTITDAIVVVNPITAAAASQVNAIYFTTCPTCVGSAASGPGGTMNFEHVAFQNIGLGSAPSSNFDGIVSVGNTGFSEAATLSIQQSHIDTGFSIQVGTDATVTISKLTMRALQGTSSAAPYLIDLEGNTIGTSSSISDVVAYSDGLVRSSSLIGTPFLQTTLNIARVMAFATSSFGLDALNMAGITGTGTGGHTVSNLGCYNPQTSSSAGSSATGQFCTRVSIASGDVTSTVTGVFSQGLSHVLYTSSQASSTGTLTASNLWHYMISTSAAAGTQGGISITGGTGKISQFVGILGACPSSQQATNCSMAYQWQSNGNAWGMWLDNGTFDASSNSGGGIPQPLSFGEGTSSARTGAGRSLIVWGQNGGTGFECIQDKHSTGTITYSADSVGGATVGVHHNATMGCGTHQYGAAGPSVNYWDGSHAHPSAAIYFDLDGINPLWAAPSRRLLTADSALFGGNGTAAHLWQALAQVSDFGGTYGTGYDAAIKANPMQGILSYLMAGYTPQHPQFWCSGYNGTSLGGVAFCAQGKARLASF